MLSVIMSVYNGESFVDRAIESVISQTYEKFEFIIINDGSTDSTLERLNLWARKDERIRLVSRENQGLINSLNEAVSLSSYDIIVRMDADDICFNNRFANIANSFLEHPEINLLSTPAEIIDINDAYVCHSKVVTEKEVLRSLPFRNYIYHPSVAFKKDFFYDCDSYLLQEKGLEDLGLWLRMKRRGVRYKYISEPGIKYRINTNSVRGVSSKHYTKVLAIECLLNHDKKRCLYFLKNTNGFDLVKLIIGLILPSAIFDRISILKTKSKLKELSFIES